MKTKIKCLTSVFLTITMLLSIIVVAPIMVNASEDDLTYGDFTYEVNNDGSCTITDYEGKSADVSIPSTICGHKVTKIGGAAFGYNESIKSVIVPNGVTNIDVGAFECCDNLTKVSLPDTITYIDAYAFAYNEKLADISIPNDVEYVGESAFEETKWLNDQPNGIVYAGKVAYIYKGTSWLNIKVSIKDGTKYIADKAFAGQYGIVEVTLPDSLRGIGSGAFLLCDSLTSINIPDGVETIEGEAFKYCEKLANITIPESVSYIGGETFADTKWFNKQADGLVYAGNNAYAYKGAMPQNTTVTLKEGTKSIAGNAFYSEENLAGIILPDSLISVGDYAFYQCENLKSVSIGKNVEKIGESAFEECTSLESITIPEKVTSISSNCFSECSALKNAELPSNLEIISDSAFRHCVSLENIEIPDSVSVLEDETFAFCEKLKSVSICSKLKSIDYRTFYECPALEKITVSGDNKYFSSKDGVMYNKGKTQIVVYPESKKDAEYTVPDTVTIIGYSDYTDDNYIENPNLKTIVIPKSVKVIKYQSIGFIWNDDAEDRVKVKNFTVKGYCSTQAEYYAKNLGLNFVALDSPKNIPAPQITKLENTANGIKITWNAVEGADAYRLYKKTSSGWKRVYDTVVMPGTVDYNVTVGKTETYTVRCLDLNGKTISGYNSKGWSKKYTPVAPTITKLENNYNGIRITWNKIAGVYGYRLYKKTSNGGWKRFKDTTATSFIDKNISAGKTETYTIRCIDKNGNTVSGFNSKGWSKKFVATTPQISGFENTSGGVKIKWDKNPCVYGYRVYQKTSNGWKRIKDTTATSVTDSAVTANQTKTYTIRCIDKNGNTVSGYNSKGWSKKYAPVAPKISKLTNTSKGVSVTWGKVAGVYGYRLYRKYDGGSWTKVKDTTAASYTDSGAKKGKKVTYTLRCIDKNGKTISGYNATGRSITRK